MAFIFGREKTIGRWLRVRPRSFFDWEKQKGCYLQSCATKAWGQIFCCLLREGMLC